MSIKQNKSLIYETTWLYHLKEIQFFNTNSYFRDIHLHTFIKEESKILPKWETRRSLSSPLRCQLSLSTVHYSRVESWIGGLDLFPRDCQLSVRDTQAANLHFVWGLYFSKRLFSGFLRNSVSRLPVTVAIFNFISWTVHHKSSSVVDWHKNK